MPVITEEDESGMEFLNLDCAGPDVGLAMDVGTGSQPVPIGADVNHDFELALENVDGDDFSFWALQHYENSNLGAMDPTVEPAALHSSATAGGSHLALQEYGATPEFPCEKCQSSGFLCKKIREGKYKGYCTSCVALRCRCSFASATATEHLAAPDFPYNPWPTLGDHPDAIPQEGTHQSQPLTASMDLTGPTSPPSATDFPPSTSAGAGAGAGPKVGTRFSRDSVRILKNWLSTHNRHPYPSDEEKEMLQKQTGLNKTQITNWLANARRRGKIVAPRSTSPGVRSFSNAIDIPQRRGTPAPLEHMNPLQRWQYSPPEHEPALISDISRAVSSSTLSSGLNSPHSLNLTDDGSGRSLCAGSSASSVNTSHSSTGSLASAYSHASRGSFGSFGSLNRGRRRRRRRAMQRSPDEKTPLTAPLKTYMCTFCTETFRTKHDWQRHEKSLHLSLERWVCAPAGPRAFDPENGQVSCVFCGKANPDDAHIEKHNHSACQERALEERTFYRKDHLRQHLKLVHGAKYVPWSMEPWKVATPEIRSRCGFCGIVMDTWQTRVDHLAEHFKTGNTMADWKGDWGFEEPVLDMVENSIPPYLIHDEMNTPQPFMATQGSPETHRNAYELIKLELCFFSMNLQEHVGRPPTDDELQVEACRVIFGAEVLSRQGISSVPSWLRDLLLSSKALTQQARLAPIRSAADSFQAQLKINGKDNIFENDPMEAELHEYVKARRLLGLTAMDSELQTEACNIVSRMEESSSNRSDEIASFILRLIYSAPGWLASFRQRAVLPRSEDMHDVTQRSKDPTTIDSTIHNYSRLETELAEYARARRLQGIEPTDADLQRQARIIIYEFDDGWNQTAADNMDWLNAFKQRHVSNAASTATLANGAPVTIVSGTRDAVLARPCPAMTGLASANANHTNTNTSVGCFRAEASQNSAEANKALKVGRFFLNDANCYRRLARELGRYVASVLSPNNPNCHVPSDEELQHQARWILYDCDDQWNQTAADNAEWLRRFKRDTGILTDPSLPGLPDGYAWSVTQGGSGFAPPYLFPNPHGAPLRIVPSGSSDAGAPGASSADANVKAVKANVEVTMREGARSFQAEAATANKYLHALTTRLSPPATVFCSRELENGLVAFVVEQVARGETRDGDLPDDATLQAKGREILGLAHTSAEDQVLLDKFKAMMRQRLGLPGPRPGPGLTISTSRQPRAVAQFDELLPAEMDMAIPDSEMAHMLENMDFDFGDLAEPVGLSSSGGLE